MRGVVRERADLEMKACGVPSGVKTSDNRVKGVVDVDGEVKKTARHEHPRDFRNDPSGKLNWTH